MTQRIFTPKELRNVPQKLKNMSELSSGYFKVACDLRDKACSQEGTASGHRYVFPAVIMYVSSLEAYFNEQLALSGAFIEDDELKEKINNIKAGLGAYKTFSARLKEIFKLYDKESKGIDTDGLHFQNFVALVELRNSAAHYNPLFIDHVEWPVKLEKVLQRSKIDVMNSGWASNFSNPEVAKWAYETTKSIISLFCGISGGINPFQCPDAHKSFRWE